ncbi:MAG TPA: electron transfer flavoprotein subunit beta/FixA family protein [Thermodesulfobacteriota bacterium]|nr:electron transfer flavoprotein subunit beta/FixA family protein [Thermodesulfobacteriota bacterium]
MNIVVCVKAVPDPKEAAKIKIDPRTGRLHRDEIALVINPLDRHALEAALHYKRTREAHLTVISMGPPAAANIVKECLALGADQGILLSDSAFGGADAYATAFTLAQGIRKIADVNLILCGTASTDGATEWVGPEIAAFLNLPVVAMVKEIQEDSGNPWKVKADWEEGARLVSVQLPAVFTVTRELNRPRTLSFSGIIKARQKTITLWTLADLNVPPESVGLQGSPTRVGRFGMIETKRSVRMLTGSLEEKAEALAGILAGEIS